MASSSSMEVNSTIEVDVRFMLIQCDCGELADVKITKSNKNNNRGRMYYSCKMQRCGTFLGWCKITSIQQASILGLRDSVVGEVNSNHQTVPWTWKFLIVLSLILSASLAIKVIM